MRKRCAVIPLLLLLCASCADRTSQVTDAALASKTPDVVVEDDGVVTQFFDSDNPYAMAQIAEAQIDPAVSAAVAHFEALGYELRDDYSFVADGVSGDGEIELRIVAMANGSSDEGDAVHLISFEADGESVVVPFAVSRNTWNPPGSYDEPVGKLNFETLAPFTSTVAVDGPGPVDWTWKRWGVCVVAGIVGGGTGCLLQCRIIPVAYLKCVGICTAGHAIASLVGCTIREVAENTNK